MGFKIGIILVLFLVSGAGAIGAESFDSCRSSAGGYCVNLAAVAQTQTAGALDFLDNPDTVAKLVANLYYWGLGLVAVAAFIMMVFGGFTYMTAGDNPGRIKEGTDYIKNALYGLVLALISWLILYTINPDLVNSLELAIPKIELRQATVPTGSSCNANQQCVAGGGGASCTSSLDCIGGGGTQYQWVNEGLNQYCVDVLGTGWRDVAPSWCGGTPPSGKNACCAFGITP